MTLDHIVEIFKSILYISFLLGASAVIIALAILLIYLFISAAKNLNRL